MKAIALAAAMLSIAATDLRAEGDIAKGERDFGRCMACHSVTNGDQVLRKGGRTGPDLFGIIGKTAGTADFAYADGLKLAGEAGLVWTEDALAEFLLDPLPFLRARAGAGVRTKMTFKMRGGEDVAAYLRSLAG